MTDDTTKGAALTDERIERELFEATIRRRSTGEPDFNSAAAMWAWAAWQERAAIASTPGGASTPLAVEPAPGFERHAEGADGWSAWVAPVMRGYLMRCCDCKLVHEVEFSALKISEEREDGYVVADLLPTDEYRVRFRMRRKARGMEARSGETAGLDPKGDSPVHEVDAPKNSSGGASTPAVPAEPKTKAELISHLVARRQALGGSVSEHNHRRVLSEQTVAELRKQYDRIAENERRAAAATPVAPAPAVPQVPPAGAVTMPPYWSVEVVADGETLVSIGYDWLSGSRPLEQSDERTILGAAQHLLSFIGYGLPPRDFDTDAPPVAPADDRTTCNCRWQGEKLVQQCTLHEAWRDAISDWADRAKKAEAKLAALSAAAPVAPVAPAEPAAPAENIVRLAEQLLNAVEAEDASDTLTSSVCLRSAIAEYRAALAAPVEPPAQHLGVAPAGPGSPLQPPSEASASIPNASGQPTEE